MANSKYPQLTPEEAAALINNGAIVAVSGFTGVGHPKLVTPAIAKRARELHAQGCPFGITLYSGASTGDEVDGELARACAITKRLPYQSSKELREQINRGQVAYVDMHLSSFGMTLRNGALPRPDVAIIEAYKVTDCGEIYLTLSAGNSAVFCSTAENIVVELTDQFDSSFDGLHDSYELKPPPTQDPLPIRSALDRIGDTFVKVDPKKIVGIVPASVRGSLPTFTQPNAVDEQIAGNVLEFLLYQRTKGRLPSELPFQVGVGNIANAVLAQMARDKRIEPISMYTEVIQDSVFPLIDAGKLRGVSSSALSFSDAALARFRRELSTLKPRFVLRPVEISNSPEVVRRLGVISMNTAVEIDIFGNVNSTHVNGSAILNGIGGSGDFCRNAFLSLYITRSRAKGGTVPTIVSSVSHVDHNEHSVQVVVTEHGAADLRGLAPNERAPLIIERCADPRDRSNLFDSLERARSEAAGRHTPLLTKGPFKV